MEELINNIKENVKININGKDYIVKTKTLYGIEEKCIFEDFVSQDQIISLGYLPDEERRADILADIIDIKNIKVVKE